jgi:hypothetical protein
MMRPCWIALLALLLTATSSAGESEVWDFAVYLNDKKIGNHVFEVTDADGVTRVESEARFKYTVLMIPAYRYEHTNTEHWSGNCLTRLDARTIDNGERIEVSGKQSNDAFTIDIGREPTRLPECVMSFAYWNPDFLQQSRLLNPQTGELVDVNVEKIGDDIVEVRGQPVAATRFRLTADNVDMTLWYSNDERWLALESVAEGGRIIRYKLT